MLSRPKILLFGLELYWPGPPRLPRAFQEAGFEVGVACRAKAFMAHTKFLDRFFPLPDKNRGRKLVARLEEIVGLWMPDLLQPTDDQTVLFLSRVHEFIAGQENSNRLADLLKRSLGDPVAMREALSKRRTLEI